MVSPHSSECCAFFPLRCIHKAGSTCSGCPCMYAPPRRQRRGGVMPPGWRGVFVVNKRHFHIIFLCRSVNRLIIFYERLVRSRFRKFLIDVICSSLSCMFWRTAVMVMGQPVHTCAAFMRQNRTRSGWPSSIHSSHVIIIIKCSALGTPEKVMKRIFFYLSSKLCHLNIT